MDESAALKVVALRAIEITDGSRTLWSDDDRAWASRAAAEIVGAGAKPEAFLARRAALALEKLGERHPALPRALRALRWRPWVGTAIVCLAFVLGVFIDQVGGALRINILAPPVIGLLIWNVAVYLVIIVGYIVRYGEDATPGPLRAMITRLARGLSPPRRGGAMRESIVAFFGDWTRRSVALYGFRASRILHFAAAALAAGVIAGLYLRGLAFEYRATWESTFLDASTVRSIVAFAYAPGAFLTGLQVPDVDAIAAIRSPAGENAARWLHLIAATIVAVVIVPRLLLALIARTFEYHRAARLLVPLDEPYFQRLLRGFRGRPAHVRVIPYSHTPAPTAITGLEAVIARTFGNVAMMFAQPVAYGADDVPTGDTAGTTLVVLFNASATPEREVHGAFLAALVRAHPGAEALVALIDEGAWAAHWKGTPTRISERRIAWRQVGEEARVPTVFVDLSAPDIASAENAFDEAIAARTQ